ncbi:diacylglycerol O-acyltransferase 2 [Heterostelium album PN500]|uniref:Acyltransferase n=1 Tax=Heterostelium pallidum (strain ATCC 26659 / Pp 5 / PN500) TaxID=670386 RepID=D3B2U8_HETP5|nr:diacylglycerol O-acyltransferase 2 [Heterostelium album PN500]EFA83646.1 diacylglycerol O-acyltransferase 2 [Heterostelium album PN500]|eukprot:XP_020435763.1 diacylglycerol O-acyltransferase 2 [Heterostelium album PN500]
MVRWIPASLPLHRRLETTAVLFYLMIVPMCMLFAFYSIIIPIFWGFTIPYLLWTFFYDTAWERGGRRNNWIRNHRTWRYFRDYFPISLVTSTKLDPAKNYIFGYHPHGIISMGAFCNFATNATGVDEKYPGITIHPLTLTSNFKIPFLRDVLMSFGISSVARNGCDNVLESGPGQSVMIVIGGAEESLDAHPGHNELLLKKRKGFVKLAFAHGASLVPIYSFGENDIFDQVDNPKGSWIRKCQTKVMKLTGIAPALFNGRGIFNYDFGLLPHRRKIVSVVGEPIDVPKVASPSDELIDHYQQLYMDSLSNLFHKYKDEYASESDDLKIH